VVRTAADRAFLPAKGLFEQVGNMVLLTGRTVVAIVRPPYPYGGEFVAQFLFALRLCWFPMLISTVAVTFGAPGLQAANFLTLVGALDRSAASSSSPPSASSLRSSPPWSSRGSPAPRSPPTSAPARSARSSTP
jgi:hypothetical protein